MKQTPFWGAKKKIHAQVLSQFKCQVYDAYFHCRRAALFFGMSHLTDFGLRWCGHTDTDRPDSSRWDVDRYPPHSWLKNPMAVQKTVVFAKWAVGLDGSQFQFGTKKNGWNEMITYHQFIISCHHLSSYHLTFQKPSRYFKIGNHGIDDHVPL